MSYTFYNYEQANTPDWNRRGEIAQMRIVWIKHYCGRDEASFSGNLLSFSQCWENASKFYEKAETEEASHRFHSCWRPRLEWGYIFIVKSPCTITCSLLINRVYIFIGPESDHWLCFCLLVLGQANSSNRRKEPSWFAVLYSSWRSTRTDIRIGMVKYESCSPESWASVCDKTSECVFTS